MVKKKMYIVTISLNISPSQSFSVKEFFIFQAYEFRRAVLQALFHQVQAAQNFHAEVFGDIAKVNC
jgi:hypothetical protein